MQLFRGLCAFPITPADTAGVVDTGALCGLVERAVGAGVDSVGLLGSTGTYAYLSRVERRRAIEAAVGCVAGRVPIIVGVGALRTDAAQDLARDSAACGADGLLLAPVSYTPLTEEEVFQHFRAVASATGLPLCIYNNPSTTHFTFSTTLVARLAQVERIVAVKNPTPEAAEMGAHLGALRAAVPAGFALGYSMDWRAAEALLAGADAWYSVVAGFLPEVAVALTRAAQAGDAARARAISASLDGLWGVFREHGGLRVAYAAANLLGLTDAQPPLPILPLAQVGREQVEQALSVRLPPDRFKNLSGLT